MRYHLARAQAKGWARSGVYLAMSKIASDTVQPGEEYDWLGGEWALFGVGDASEGAVNAEAGFLLASAKYPDRRGHVAVHISDEESRLNLNSAGEEMLSNLLHDPKAAKEIVDYIDADHEGEGGFSDMPYARKDLPIERVEELSSIPDIRGNKELLETIFKFSTVYTSGSVNINTASPEVIGSISGDPALATQLISNRSGLDGILGTDDDCKATKIDTAAIELSECSLIDEESLVGLIFSFPFEVSSQVFRIVSVGFSERPKTQHRIEAIVSRSQEVAKGRGQSITVLGQAFRIIGWKEI
jgi:DNA uptake protein ComE-like DNA-binding protein